MTPPRLLTPRLAAFVLAIALALALGHSVFRIPVQVSDSLDVIVAAAGAPSAMALFAENVRASDTTLRPLRYLQARWLVRAAEITGLSYNAVFRGLHATLAVMLVLLFTALLPIRGWLDVAAVAFALTVFIGSHTFTAMLREAFPVNHFAEVAVGALLVVAIAQRRARWYAEAFVLLLLAFGLLLVEAAVLLWVIIVTGALLRMPGLRLRTAAAATVLLLVYAGARQYFEIMPPAIGAHGSGYGDAFYSAGELRERFGSYSLSFMAYNVAGAVLSVLMSEPRAGVYQLLAARATGATSPVVLINIVSSLIVTAVLVWYTVRLIGQGRKAWRAEDHLVVLTVAMLVASAALCLTYIKDEILSVAGIFYALAAFVAARELLAVSGRSRVAVVAAAALFFAVAGPLWAFRAAGVHFELRRTAYYSRNDWASVLSAAKRDDWPDDVRDQALIRQFKEEALQRRVASPTFLPRWGERYWVQ